MVSADVSATKVPLISYLSVAVYSQANSTGAPKQGIIGIQCVP